MGEIQRLELHIDRRAFVALVWKSQETVWWICKTLKRIQSSFSIYRRHILTGTWSLSQFSRQEKSHKMPLILNLTIPFTEFRVWSPRKIGILVIWEDPWTYVKALAARILCGFFFMQISRRCEGLMLPVMRDYKLVCGKMERSLST